MHTEGTVIYLDTWTSTDEDLSQLPHIIMTSPHPCNPSEVQFPKTSQRVEEELTMRSITSVTTDHGMSTMKFDDVLDIEDCLYSIEKLYHRMLSGVHILDAPTVKQIQIFDMKRTIANNTEETNMFTPTTFLSSQRHSTVDASSLSDWWDIGVAWAALTLKATTQKYVRSALLPLAR